MSAAEDVLVGRYNSVIGSAQLAFHRGALIERTFDLGLKKLPAVGWLETIIVADQKRWRDTGYTWESTVKTSEIRSEYVKRSFPILTDEFIADVIAVVRGLRVSRIVELCSGTGWFSHWLNVYGLDVTAAIDNKSWPGFEGRFLSLVENGDSLEYVRENPETDLIILSWPPYDSDLASLVWGAMKEGTYLLYVGEGSGGCTADDKFFEALPEKEPETGKLGSRFISFWGIHDRPVLYRKGGS